MAGIKKLFRNAFQGMLLSFRQLKRGDRNVMIFITYGLLYEVFINLYKPFSVKFLTRLGGGAFHISLLNSLPGILAVFALIPGSLIISRFKRKKGVVSIFFAISRAFVLALAFVPFLPERLRPIIFVILLSAMNFPDAISQTGLQGFLGDVFDGRTRSQAITLRNKFGQIVAPVITLATGLIVTYIPKTEAQTIIAYQVFFAMAFAAGMLEVWTFRKFDEPDKKEETPAQERPGWRSVPATLKNKKFMAYLIPTIFFYFMYQAGWPLFSILQVVDLGATEMHVAVNAAVSGLFGFLGANFWSKLTARKGNDFTTFLAALSLALCVFMSALSPNIYAYIAFQAFGGFVGIGVVISLLNGLLSATPEKNRVIYISVYNTFVNISLGISPFFANALYDALGTRTSMFVIGFGRLAAAIILLFIYLKHRKEQPQKPKRPKKRTK